MVKLDIVERVSEKMGFSKKESSDLVESVFAIIKKTLESGEDVKLPGFGAFQVKQKADRLGRNPATCEKMTIVARRVVSFKPSQLLRKGVSGTFPLTS